MQFQLITASGLAFDGPAYEVLIPTLEGVIAVAEDHMPLISAGAPGVLSVRKKAGDSERDMEHFAVFGGVVQTDGKLTRFVTDDVTTTEEVSEKEAADALKRAENLVKNAGSQVAIEEARQVLHHATVRLHLSRLKSRHHR